MKCISTYTKALRPPKTESGSDTSWLLERNRYLWGGGKTESGLHCSPSQRLRVCLSACARVSVRACFPQETTTSIEHTHRNGHRYANARNMHTLYARNFELAYNLDGNV